MKPIVYLAIGVLASSNAWAGGYRVSTQGQIALGMGHTGVALSESAESVFFNPGAMTRLESDRVFTGGVTLLDGKTEYDEGSISEETDNPTGTPVGGYYAAKISDEMSWGLGIYNPYGNRVEWPTDWAGSHLVNTIDLKTTYIQPTISYAVNDKTSIGFGPTYVVGSVELNRNISSIAAVADASGDRFNVTLEADGVTAWGYNLGIHHQVNDQLDIGVSYRSEVTLEAKDDKAKFDNFPVGPFAPLGAAFATADSFDADLVLPAELTLGVAFRPNDKMTLAFDVNYAYWDAYDELKIEFNNGLISENPREYENSSIYRFGVQYEFDESWTFRGGIYRDESPVQDGYFAPETPRNDSTGYTFGASYKQSDKLVFDASVLILTFDEVENSYDFFTEPVTTAVTPFEGTYESSVTSIGFGVTYNY